MKWSKSLSVDGLDDVRGNLIDKLDDIETQQGEYSIKCGILYSISTYKKTLD
jgi:hypothetical protein